MIGDAVGPIQIIGSPRSGTSALSWALNEHPKLGAGPESDFVWHLCGKGRLHESYRLSVERGDETWLRFFGVQFPEFCHAIGIGIDAVFSSCVPGLRWIDSTPAHTLMAGELALMLPRLRFLHLVRDGREVAASMLNSGFNEEWSCDFGVACRTWSHYVEVGVAFETRFPERVLRVHHSALVADPVGECARILAFLGCEPDERPAQFLLTQRVNSSYDNQQPGDIRAVKSTARLREPAWLTWSNEQLQRFWDIAGGQMELLDIAYRRPIGAAPLVVRSD